MAPRKPKSEPVKPFEVVVIATCLWFWALMLWESGALRPLGW